MVAASEFVAFVVLMVVLAESETGYNGEVVIDLRCVWHGQSRGGQMKPDISRRQAAKMFVERWTRRRGSEKGGDAIATSASHRW